MLFLDARLCTRAWSVGGLEFFLSKGPYSCSTWSWSGVVSRVQEVLLVVLSSVRDDLVADGRCMMEE